MHSLIAKPYVAASKPIPSATAHASTHTPGMPSPAELLPPRTKRVPVSASVRAIGLDDLPDTFYVFSFPRRVKKLGVGSRLLVSVRRVKSESLYEVTLGPVRVRGDTVVEFIGYSTSFIHQICYIQLPLSHARVSKFPIVDCLRGILSFTDPLPDRYVRYMQPVKTPSISGEPPATSDDDDGASSVERIHVGIETPED